MPDNPDNPADTDLDHDDLDHDDLDDELEQLAARRRTVSELVAATIAGSLLHLLDHAPAVNGVNSATEGAPATGYDAEAVHQARVATRRLRSDLRTLRRLIDDEARGMLNDELKRLGALLGAVRDHDVLTERLTGDVAALAAEDAAAGASLLEQLRVERRARHEQLRHELAGSRYAALRQRLLDAARQPPLAHGVDPDAPADAALARAVRRAERRVERHAERIGASSSKVRRRTEAGRDTIPDEALHELRKRAKQARYANELRTGKAARRRAKAYSEMQSALGDLQDALTAGEWLRRGRADGPAGVAFVAGALAREEEHRADAARRSWPRAWVRIVDPPR